MLRAIFFLLVFLQMSIFSLETVNLAEHLQKKEKPALLVFLTVNSCPWCDKLSQEILEQEEFKTSINESFNLLKVYVSEAKAEMLKKYHIDQVPVFVLVDKEGVEMTRVGYLPKTPKEMAEHLKGLLGRADVLQEKIAHIDLKGMPVEILRHYYTEAKTLGLRKIQTELLSTGLQIDAGTFFLLEQYKSCLSSERKKAKKIKEEIKNRDPNNQEGSFLELAFVDFQLRQEENQSFEQVVKPLKKYLKYFGKEDQDNGWKVEMALVKYCLIKGRKEEALEHAKKALQEAPLEAQEDIKEAISYIREINNS